jgi:hypothetical protein
MADQSALPILRSWTRQAGLQRASTSVRRAVELLDDGETDGKVLLSTLLLGANRNGGGERGLALWALQLQGVSVRLGASNYLASFFFELRKYSEKITSKFLRMLATSGIVVGFDSGYFDDLSHMDPRLAAPTEFIDARVAQNGYELYLDGFAKAFYDQEYRPAVEGRESRIIQLMYANGRRLDVDYQRVCDNFDPASMLSLMRSYIGPANISIPARISRDTAPRLFNEKRKVLERLGRYNDDFTGFVAVATVGLAQALPFGTVGQIVPLKQVFPRRLTGPVLAPASAATTKAARSVEQRAVGSGQTVVGAVERAQKAEAAVAERGTSAVARGTGAKLVGGVAESVAAQERRVVNGVVDTIEESSAVRAADDPAFLELLDRGRAGITGAGTRFHVIAETEAREFVRQSKLPANYALRAEERIGAGAGSSRIDLLITTPSGRSFEFDWKTSILSGLSKSTRESEIPKHAAAIRLRGMLLEGQESRSWGPAVVRALRRLGRLESLTARQRQALAPWL